MLNNWYHNISLVETQGLCRTTFFWRVGITAVTYLHLDAMPSIPTCPAPPNCFVLSADCLSQQGGLQSPGGRKHLGSRKIHHFDLIPATRRAFTKNKTKATDDRNFDTRLNRFYLTRKYPNYYVLLWPLRKLISMSDTL